jgi:hypothetical protein
MGRHALALHLSFSPDFSRVKNVAGWKTALTVFSARHSGETVETVSHFCQAYTRLKPGVNEKFGFSDQAMLIIEVLSAPYTVLDLAYGVSGLREQVTIYPLSSELQDLDAPVQLL